MKAQMIQDKNVYVVSAEDGTFRTFFLNDKAAAEELLREKEGARVPGHRPSAD